jgi:hypothetical protein
MMEETPDWPARLLRSHGYKLYLSIFVLNLLWNGFSSVEAFSPPSVVFAAANAQDPFGNPAERNYYRESPLFFLLAHWIGATSPRAYLLFCTAMAVAVQIAFLGTSVWKLGKENGVTVALLFLTHPITYILNTWLGMVDPLTVACTIVLLYTESPFPVFAAATCSMFNHSSATTVIASGLLAFKWIARPGAATGLALAAGAAGMANGKMCCYATYQFYTTELFTRWDFFQELPLSTWLTVNFSHFSICVYSLLFALWIPMVAILIVRWAEAPQLVLAYVALMLGFYGVTFVALDTTRVFAIFSWAPTLFLLMTSLRAPSPGDRWSPGAGALIRWTALLGWLAPHLFAWQGGVHSPGLWEMIQFVKSIYPP